jgi:hypothetical protein
MMDESCRRDFNPVDTKYWLALLGFIILLGRLLTKAKLPPAP